MNQTKPSWTLTGWGFSTLCLYRLSRAQAYIPSRLQVQPVIPGHTLGGYYGLHYDESPIGPYDELIVFPGLVTFGKKMGCYVSHSFVNNQQALHGGLHSWRWPRDVRRITATAEGPEWGFELFEAGRVVFAAEGRCLTPTVPLHFSIPFIDDTGGQVVWYSGLFDTQIQLTRARIKVESDCPFGRLTPVLQLASVGFKSLHVVLGLPAAVRAAPIHQPAYAAPAISANGISDFGFRVSDFTGRRSSSQP